MCCTVRFDGLRGVPSGRVPIVPPQAASVEIRLIASGLLNYFWICAANPRFHCRCCTSQHRLDFRLPHFLQHGRPAGHLCGAAGRAEPAGVLLSVARRIHHPRGAGRAGGRSGRQPRGGRPAAVSWEMPAPRQLRMRFAPPRQASPRWSCRVRRNLRLPTRCVLLKESIAHCATCKPADNAISANGVRALAALMASNASLTSLDLSGTPRVASQRVSCGCSHLERIE